jgi:hypothetical protein
MAMNVASLTRLRLRSSLYLPRFIFYALRSIHQTKQASGCLGATARRANGSFWTITLWKDVESMRAFMLSGAHRSAMPHLVNWCDEAATARFEWAESTLPGWDIAEQHMASHGKLSPVKYPSAAHTAGLALGTAGMTGVHMNVQPQT